MILEQSLEIIKGQSLEQTYNVQDMVSFLSDMQTTFRKERHGIVGAWQYSDSEGEEDSVRGAFLWERFLKESSDYYPLKSEIELIRDYSQDLLTDLNCPITLVDFGPGPLQPVHDKTIPIAEKFQNLKAYYPIDKSYDYLLGASNTIHKKFPEIQIKAFNADYFKDEIELSDTNKVVALFFGSSISNLEGHPDNGLPAQEVIQQLERLGRIISRKGGTLLMAYDSNQDESSILRSYSHHDQVAFGANIMHRVKRDLPVYGHFVPESWQYEAVWHGSNHQLCHTVVCLEDQSFILGRENFSIKKGERFILNNSFKYPVSKMEEWGRQAGFSKQTYVRHPLHGTILHAMTDFSEWEKDK